MSSDRITSGALLDHPKSDPKSDPEGVKTHFDRCTFIPTFQRTYKKVIHCTFTEWSTFSPTGQRTYMQFWVKLAFSLGTHETGSLLESAPVTLGPDHFWSTPE